MSNRSLDHLQTIARGQMGWLAVVAAVGLSAIGIAAIGTVAPQAALAQTKWLFAGLLVMAACLLIRPRQLGLVSYVLFVAVVLMLLFLVIPGVPRNIVPMRNGATRWLNMQFMMFQPSELAKIVFVIAMAWYLRHRESYRTLRGLLVPLGILLIPMAAILKQPDLGTALLFPPVLFAMLVAAGAKLRHLLMLGVIAVIIAGISVAAIFVLPESMQLLKPHQRTRIVTMISQAQGETRFNDGAGYQQHKARMLLGAGGVTGYGKDQSQQVMSFNRLPHNHNDMIFVVIVNRWGLIGGSVTLGLYMFLILCLLTIAAKSKDPFARLTVVGFASLLFCQATINIGIALSLLPVTGLTLPFISYGGSSLVTMLVMIGLAMNFASQPPAIITRPSFEFDQTEAVLQ